MERKYILKKGDLYLAEITKIYDEVNSQNKLINFIVDNDYLKLYDDFELAEDDRKLIYIETGLSFEVKLFKKEEE
jgi:hypothetical protein